MYKIVNGQWSELTEEDFPDYRNQSGSYQEWLKISNKNANITVSIRQDGQKQRWKADVLINSNAPNRSSVSFNTTVYIDQFPDLLTFLRDAEMLERLLRP